MADRVLGARGLRLPATLDANARVKIDIAGGGSGTRRTVHFAAGTGLAVTVVDDAPGEAVTVTPSLLETHLRYAALELSAAQVKALKATPIECIAAPGVGKMIEFVSAVLAMDYGTVVYVVAANDLQFKYTNGAGPPVSLISISAGFLDQAADGARILAAQGSPYFTKAQAENTAVVLHNIGLAELLNGDSPLAVRATYRVHLTGW